MAHPPVPDSLPRLAAIDIGTNSIRLVVAQPETDGTYQVLDEERATTRLGEGLSATGRLAADTMERSLEAIGKMKAIAAGFGVAELRAVGTSAVREAENGAEFCREVWRRHRVKVEVITAEDEARYAFESALRRFNLEGRPVAVVDIGGGSLDVVLAAGSVVDQVYSLDLGAVHLTERHVRSDPLRRRHWRALRDSIDEAIRDRMRKNKFVAELMVGSGGTFSTLGAMARYEQEGREGTPQGYMLSRAEASRLLARLREIPLEGRKQLPGLSPGRADIILAGVAVVLRLAKHLGTRQILVNDGGVRDGLLLSMIKSLPGVMQPRAPQPAARLDAVRTFARKCRVNGRHAERVALLAGKLFDGLRRPFDMPPAWRELLVSSALVHDVGYLVNHAKHHKHAYHLIMHSDLPGFSAREVELIANIVRYHRRAYPRKSHSNFARLERADRRLVRRLAAILRIAVGLDRTHTQAVTDVRVRVRGGRVNVLAVAKREPRVELWDARRKAGLFRRAFDAGLSVTWDGADQRRHGLRVVRGQRRVAGA